jgi:hypothetical protein
MPNQNPPDLPEHMVKPQRFGQYGFQPLGPVMRNDIPTGVVLSEQINITGQPIEHYQRRHIDVETVEAHMLMRAKRKPTDWKPMAWVFTGTVPIQIAGIRVGRESLLFFNGSDDILIARKEVDCRATSNENFVLKLNNTLAIETEGEFWANAATGVTLQTIETWFDLDALILAQKKIDHRKLELRHYGDMMSQQQERKIS